MGQRGPLRNPNSRRGRAEILKRQKLAANSGGVAEPGNPTNPPAGKAPPELPTCDKCLPRRVQEIYQNLVIDLAASGVPLKQIDSYPLTQVARKLFVIEEAEKVYADAAAGYEIRVASMGAAERAGKDLIQWYKLACIGPGERARQLGLKPAPEKKGGRLAELLAARAAKRGS